MATLPARREPALTRPPPIASPRHDRPTYAEEHYTAMMRKAYPLWESAQQEARTSVYTPTGGLDFGPAQGAGMRRVLAAAEANGVRAEHMDAERVSRRFPGFSIPDHWTALWNADAGILNATKAVAMYAGLAERHGAALRDRSAVVGIDHAEDGMMRLAVQDNSRGASSGAGTGEGAGGGVAQSVVARRVVVAAGPWAGALLEDTLGLRLDLRPIATAVAYWRARDAQARHRFDAARFPVYICYGDDQTEADALPPGWDETDGSTGDSRASIDFQTLYGFPIHELPGLIKASLHLPEAHWERLGRDADDRTMAPDVSEGAIRASAACGARRERARMRLAWAACLLRDRRLRDALKQHDWRARCCCYWAAPLC